MSNHKKLTCTSKYTNTNIPSSVSNYNNNYLIQCTIIGIPTHAQVVIHLCGMSKWTKDLWES